MTDDSDLERLMRDGLHRRAEDADTTAPVAERARVGARRRRSGRVVAGVAALAVAAVAVTGFVVSRPDAQAHQPQVVDRPTTAADPLPTEWRTEYWHDTQVDVPADWGWGTAPAPIGARGPVDLYLCGGPGAMVTSDGKRLTNADPAMAYVGRPIMLSDMCVGGEALTNPQAPYVWLGAAVEPGTIDLGDGYVQETVEVNGSTVTVASQDAALRDRILSSATGGETCGSELDSGALFSTAADGVVSEATRLTVCAYRDPGLASGAADLTYATVLGSEAVDAYLRAVTAGPTARDQCPTADFVEGEWVVLELDNAEGSIVRRDVVHFVCPGIDTSATALNGAPETIALSPAMVRPWAVGGIPATVTGTFGDHGELADYFIGMLG